MSAGTLIALRALTIAGVSYAPGEVIDPSPLKPRTLTAMLEQRQIGYGDAKGDTAPSNASKRTRSGS